MKLELPRYVVARAWKSKVGLYFMVPTRLKPKTWPAGSIRLSDDIQEAFRQAKSLNDRLDAERGGRPLHAHLPGSIPALVRGYQNRPEYKKLSKHTHRLDTQTTKHLITWSEKAGHPHIKHLTRPVILKYLTKFEDRPTLRKKVGSMIRQLCTYAMDVGELAANPAMELRLKENRKAPHIYTDEEVDRLIAKAEELRMPEMVTAILIAFEIGQREGDILSMRAPKDYSGGIFTFTQSKGKQIMRMPAPAKLRARLEGIQEGHLTGWRYTEDYFRHAFKRLRDAAGLPPEAKFMHFRHTACVRLARAGCTVPEIAAISGHTIQSVHAILKRYLPRDEVVARNAIDKLDNYKNLPRSTDA